MNYFLIIEYDGTDFSGWQKQLHGRTVQNELERAIKIAFDVTCKVTGAGRTDKGVHAHGQAACFKMNADVPEKKLVYSLNSLLPKSIAIRSSTIVPDDFNARFSAKKKIYKYYIWNTMFRSVWAEKYSWHIRSKIDSVLMRQAAQHLIGEHDNSAFDASGSTQPNKVVTMEKITISRNSNGYLVLTFMANRFLYKMVRNITGTLVEVGQRRLHPDVLKEALGNKRRFNDGETAPSHGLFLEKIIYEK
jgi:tRNA pseudouridine38-40 synthase